MKNFTTAQKMPDVVMRRSLLTQVRHKLIQWLAGKHVVILNATLDIQERAANDPATAHANGISGFLVSECQFVVNRQTVLVIGQNKKPTV